MKILLIEEDNDSLELFNAVSKILKLDYTCRATVEIKRNIKGNPVPSLDDFCILSKQECNILLKELENSKTDEIYYSKLYKKLQNGVETDKEQPIGEIEASVEIMNIEMLTDKLNKIIRKLNKLG